MERAKSHRSAGTRPAPRPPSWASTLRESRSSRGAVTSRDKARPRAVVATTTPNHRLRVRARPRTRREVGLGRCEPRLDLGCEKGAGHEAEVQEHGRDGRGDDRQGPQRAVPQEEAEAGGHVPGAGRGPQGEAGSERGVHGASALGTEARA